MSTSFTHELRSARLTILAALAVQLGDIDAARRAVDGAITALSGQDTDVVRNLTGAAWEAADLNPPAPAIDPEDEYPVLTLLTACGHPSLPQVARIALMLSAGAGLDTEEISRVFAVSTETMERRLGWSADRVRPLMSEPIADQVAAESLGRVLDVLMLVFDDGVVHPHCHVDLPAEAVETTRVLVELFPGEQEPRALLALMLLTRARRDARQSADGSLVPLEVQDRSLWHRSEIEEGLFLLRGSKRAGRTGPYQIRASIQAAHVTAEQGQDTDWDALLALHDQLMQVAPSDTAALSRATTLSAVRGPQAALQAVERLGLDNHLYHATRAHLLRQMGHDEEAEHAWTAAVARVRGASEHARMRGELGR